MSEPRPRELRQIPIDHIEVLNPRERNSRAFGDIVANIRSIGLKKPIVVAPRRGAGGDERYLLVCGEGRMKALKALGESTIPVPRCAFQTRFTMTRMASGCFTIASANSRRPLPFWKGFGSPSHSTVKNWRGASAPRLS